MDKYFVWDVEHAYLEGTYATKKDIKYEYNKSDFGETLHLYKLDKNNPTHTLIINNMTGYAFLIEEVILPLETSKTMIVNVSRKKP